VEETKIEKEKPRQSFVSETGHTREKKHIKIFPEDGTILSNT